MDITASSIRRTDPDWFDILESLPTITLEKMRKQYNRDQGNPRSVLTCKIIHEILEGREQAK